MYDLRKLVISNLFSHEETELVFNNNQTTLVYGKNNDEEGCVSNGAGKSVIFEAICLALTGESYRGVSKEDFIRDGESLCIVKLFLFNNFLKKNVIIVREFHKSKANSGNLIVNDEPEKLTGIPHLNQKIFELLGISKEDLFDYFIIGDDSGASFLASTDAQKKKIISRFSRIDQVDDVLKSLQKDYEEFLLGFKDLDDMMKENQAEIENLKQKKEELIQNYNNNLKEEIHQYESDLSDIKSEISGLQTVMNSNRILLQEKQKEFEALPLIDFKSKQKEKETVIELISNYNLMQGVYNSEIQKLEFLLEEEIECPKCGHEFLINSKEDRKSVAKTMEQIKVKRNDLIKKIEKASLRRKQIVKEIDEMEEILETKEGLNTSINNLNVKLERKKTLFQEKESQRDKIQKRIDNKKMLLKKKPDTVQLDQQIITLKSERNESEEFYSECLKQKEMYEFWIQHFGRAGFVTYLSNKIIKNIEFMINKTIQKYKINIPVMISGFKRLKSGEVRDKIDVFVLKNGRKPASFNRLSSGQKARLNISAVLALHSLINDSTEGRGLNFLAIDETFDKGLDQLGQKATLEVLTASRITTLLISHNNNEIGAENRITVELNNQISRIAS